ncbi:MAG: Gfo/Idh/MocA family oxidoreductase [Candidatus Yanofskybacteria bacterium]|nr:Gfo/Idh/MocA family oxidoreductase [Candidatus Yanofskybacteria bacterium]
MTNPVRLGFIGCGGHSGRHADVVLKMPLDYRITGAFDLKNDVVDDFIKSRRAYPCYAENRDLKKFLAISEIEAVLIGTPHRFHLEQAAAAIEAGKHVLCEKPLWEGQGEKECKRILREAVDKNLIFSSCHLRRYEKEYMYIKEHIGEYIERFGRALEVRFQFFYHEPSTGWKMNDSLLLDHMNHEIDLVHFLFGHSSTHFWRISHSFDEYRVASKTESGLAIWFTGYRRLKTHTFRNELELIFERGRVRTEVILNSTTGMVSSQVSEVAFEDDSEITTRFRAHSYDDALVGVMINFADAIRGRDECYLTAQDMLCNTTICNDLVANEYGNL